MALSTTTWVYIVSECVVGLLAILTNLLVLIAIYRTKSLRTITNCFLGSLALADMLVGIFLPPVTILSYLEMPRNFHGCVLLNCCAVIFTNNSILNLVAITMERYVAICHPFLYQRVMTIRRAMAVSAVIWVLAILLGLVPNMGWNKGEENFMDKCGFTRVIPMEFMVYMIFFGVNLPPLIIMLCVYIYIFYIIRKLSAKVASQMTVVQQNNPYSSRRQKREVHGAKSLVVVIILFAVCWMPIHILNSITLLAPEKAAPYELLLFTIVLSHANSFMNPIVYAFVNTKFRRAFMLILGCPSSMIPPSEHSYTSHMPTERVRNNKTNAHEAATRMFTSDSSESKAEMTQTYANGVTNIAYDGDSDDPNPLKKSESAKSVRFFNSNGNDNLQNNNTQRPPIIHDAAVWATVTSKAITAPGVGNHSQHESAPDLSVLPCSLPCSPTRLSDDEDSTPSTVCTENGPLPNGHVSQKIDQDIVLEEYSPEKHRVDLRQVSSLDAGDDSHVTHDDGLIMRLDDEDSKFEYTLEVTDDSPRSDTSRRSEPTPDNSRGSERTHNDRPHSAESQYQNSHSVTAWPDMTQTEEQEEENSGSAQFVSVRL